MKPQSFAYDTVESVDAAISLLVEHGDEAKIIAGGQSLLPMMNFRLARPTALIDLNRVSELDYLRVDESSVHVGSMTRHLNLERCDIEGPIGTLLRESAAKVGHLPIRVRGTMGGSVAHSDPSSEWCMLSVLLDASMTISGPTGTREVEAKDFFVTVFTTCMEFDEILTEIRFPVLPPTTFVSVQEFARRKGDFAIAAIMAAIDVEGDVIRDARLVAGGVADRAVRLSSAEESLRGQPLNEETFRVAAEIAATEVSPAEDLHGPTEFRQDLVRALTRRALVEARA